MLVHEILFSGFGNGRIVW